MTGANFAYFLKKKKLTKNIYEMFFKLENDISFTAGQFINIKIETSENFPCFRAYSIVSYDKKNKEIKFCIKLIENGRGSNYLKGLKKSEKIMFIGPTGKFNIDTKKEKHSFIATGTGIAPVKALIDELIETNPSSKIQLLFGLREENDIFYENEFKKLEKLNPNFKFILTLSKPSKNWDGEIGRVTDYLEKNQKFISKKEAVYICGNPTMITDCEKILEKQKINPKNIHTERY